MMINSLDKEDLYRFRSRLGLTQERLGELLGMSRANYCRLETGADGRRLTKIQRAALRSIAFLAERGLLEDYLYELAFGTSAWRH